MLLSRGLSDIPKLVILVVAACATSNFEQNVDITPPAYNDEDRQSQEVPSYLACDACKAIVAHAQEALERAERDAGHKKLGEARVLEILEEDVCQFNVQKLLDVDPQSHWHKYGIKLVDAGFRKGDRILDGVGLPANHAMPGTKRIGDTTLPGRLGRRCAEIVGDIGEFELYSTLRAAEDWGSLGQLESDEGIGKIPSAISSVCSEMTSWCQDTTTKRKGKLRKGKRKAKGKTKGKTGRRRSSSKWSQKQALL